LESQVQKRSNPYLRIRY